MMLKALCHFVLSVSADDAFAMHAGRGWQRPAFASLRVRETPDRCVWIPAKFLAASVLLFERYTACPASAEHGIFEEDSPGPGVLPIPHGDT